MKTFTLDTSGAVPDVRGKAEHGARLYGDWHWSDLSPFAQGYIEAMLREVHIPRDGMGAPLDGGGEAGFSDLAPETLAAIMRDCEHVQDVSTYGSSEDGDHFWKVRQSGLYPETWPPFTPYLDDTGKVRLREAATA